MRFKPCEVHTLEDAIAVVKAHNDARGRDRRRSSQTFGRSCRGRSAGSGVLCVGGVIAAEDRGWLVKSPMQRMLGNVFFRINRPPYPSKMFSDEDKALSLAGFASRVGMASSKDQLREITEALVAMARLDFSSSDSASGRQ